MLGFRVMALSGNLGESGLECFGGTEIDFRVWIEWKVEEVAEGFGAISLST